MDMSPQIDRPFRVGFLLINGFPLMAYASAKEPLRSANKLSGKELYDIRNLPAVGAQSVSSDGAIFKADAYPGEQVDFDLLIVIGGDLADDGVVVQLCAGYSEFSGNLLCNPTHTHPDAHG